MSVSMDEIRAACTEIADNQKKIYALGYADGKASVKHITFIVQYESWGEYCAFEGMTWRDFVNSDMSSELFAIKNEKVFYVPYPGDEYWLGCEADDEIVDKGMYLPLANILWGDDEFFAHDGFNLGLCVEIYNEGKYYVDDNGNIRATDGRMLIAGEGWGEMFTVKAGDYVDMSGAISYRLSSDSDVIVFNIDGKECVAKRGYTWEEYANSDYSQYSYTVEGDVVLGSFGGCIQLSGVNVNPTDVIIEGANYEIVW